MNFYIKYLKYKNKYLYLKNLIGGGKDSAKMYFTRNLYIEPLPQVEFNNPIEAQRLLSLSDEEFNAAYTEENRIDYINVSKIRNNERKEVIFNILIHDPFLEEKPEATDNKTNDSLNALFEIIYEKLLTLSNDTTFDLNKYIDFIIKSYINNTFRIDDSPSSFRNIGIFKELIQKYKMLDGNKHLYVEPGVALPNKIPFNFIRIEDMAMAGGLLQLHNYITSEPVIAELARIEAKREQRIEKAAIEVKKKLEGDTATPIFVSENVRVYIPRTLEESKFYGSNTKWCTAAEDESKNLFHKYDDYPHCNTIDQTENYLDSHQTSILIIGRFCGQ
jgi:hypothetical protein